MANRAGLVIPPSTASLPQPGSAPQRTAAAPGGEAFPVNPEDRKKQNTAEIVKRHEAFCAKARQRFETGMTDTIANSPWGACHQSVLRNFTGYDLSGKKAVGKQ
jgi:chitodextrinase